MQLQPGEADRIDAAARWLPLTAIGSDAPTGVGFCMALNKAFLDLVPQLDTIFGRGYGEEVDWCQKTRALGGRHLVQPRLFVEHRGGASFGPNTKNALLARNNSRISARYPTYDADVQRYVAEDPIRTARLALGLIQAAQVEDHEIPLYLAHSWGGGAEFYLSDQLQSAIQEQGVAIVLRVGGRKRWHLELHTVLGVTQGGCNDIETIMCLLAPVKKMRVIYSCGVGDPKPQDLPEILIRIARKSPIEVLFHDYFPLTPSYHLLDKQGCFHGVPNVLSEDPAHQFLPPFGGDVVTLRAWRSAWGSLLQASEHLVVFSPSSAKLLCEAFPNLEPKIVVRPHRLHHPVKGVKVSGKSGQTIGILGNINAHKGAAVTMRLAQNCFATGEAKVVLIGDLDPAYEIPKGLTVHGSYALQDLPSLVARYGISCWVIPSIWPETFSYTTHEALATGLPVFVFDLGAQAGAAERAVNGHVVRFGEPESRAGEILDAIRAETAPKERSVA
jgi:glycosyltransferase involved in cell wall biosynthesis